MTLPAAIKKQVAEANRLHQTTYAPGEEPEQVEDDQPESQNVAPPAPPQDDDEKWETRYRVLQGKYNAEVPVLQREKRELEQRLARVEDLLGTMRQQAPAQPEPIAVAQLVSPEEVADYGEDFMDMVGRVARQVNQQEITKLNQTIEQLRGQLQNVGGKVQKNEQNEVYAKLDAAVENWRDINKDLQFLEWLADRDAFSGLVRRDLLQEAFNRTDAERVIAFFNGFLREHATVTPKGGSRPGPKPDTGKTTLDKLVAPGRQRTGSAQHTGARDEKRTWTEAEITQFYHDKQRGAFKNDPKQMAELENDIFAAQREGRIEIGHRVPHSNAAY